MHFFVHSRAAAIAAEIEDRPAIDTLNREHWSYMDRFAAGMVARGPTLAADRQTWTGSVHIVDLPSAEAARRFVEDEPYNLAGLFEEHLTRRFENLLGRTMWEFRGGSDEPRFMVIAHGRAGTGRDAGPGRLSDLAGVTRERLIVFGELLTSEERPSPAGVVLALQAPNRQALDTHLDGRPWLHELFDVQVHDWEFGGRR